MIKAIFAQLPDSIIGLDNTLPWIHSKYRKLINFDMLNFKNLTEGKDIVMGYNTWASLNFKKLKNRNIHYIITSKINKEYYNSDIIYLTLESFISLYKSNMIKEYMLIGGAKLIKSLIEYCSVIYRTTLNLDDIVSDSKLKCYIDDETIDFINNFFEVEKVNTLDEDTCSVKIEKLVKKIITSKN